MFARPSFLADIVQPSASENISRAISRGVAVRLARLPDLDEVRVLGEAAGVEEERLPVPVAERADAAEVLERHRLPAARVVRHGHHHERDAVARRCSSSASQRLQVDVALERVDQRRARAPRR